jgi:hypothetical protein
MSFDAKMAFEGQNEAEECMSDHIFQTAYARVRARHDDSSWFALSPREITDLIYREIRAIDCERLMNAGSARAPMAFAAE